MKKFFRPNLYLYFITLWVTIGWIGTSLVYTAVKKGMLAKLLVFMQDLWGLLVIFILGFSWHFIERSVFAPYILGNDLVVNKVLSKLLIPIKDITSLRYSTTLGGHYLGIIYNVGDSQKKLNLRVEDYDTHTITDLNASFCEVNSSLVPIMDDDTKKFLERRKALHLKIPKSYAGWIVFALKWIVSISIATCLFLLIIN